MVLQRASSLHEAADSNYPGEFLESFSRTNLEINYFLIDDFGGVNELREKAKSFEADLPRYTERAQYEELLNQVQKRHIYIKIK